MKQGQVETQKPAATLRFRAANRDIFEAIRTGRKKIETRAASPKYVKITPGAIVYFVCGQDKFFKKISGVKRFKSVAAMSREYKPSQINPFCATIAELRAMYGHFPGYKEKLAKYGLVVWELQNK